MEYSYQARDAQGALRTGTVEAATVGNASEILHQHGLIIIKILPVTKTDILENIALFNRVPMKEIVLFSRQLATLINAKVPIVQALKILELQVSSKRLRQIISEVAVKVESGDSLSVAITNYPQVFSGLYINLVHAGELSGTLDESLLYLANQVEKDYDLRSKVIGALTYPLFIVVALVIVGILMFIYVLPPMVEILQESSVDLPFTTKILITVTNFIQNFWWIVILMALGSIVGFRYYIHTFGGRYFIDWLIIRIPVFGKLVRSIYMARFARNLATLVAGGIPIVKALDAVADIVGNYVYRDIIFDASHQVQNGKSIALAFVDKEEFPPIVSQMVQIGESTGKLQEILEKLASFYEKEVDAVIKVLTTLIEPLIMMLLGLAVAVMVAGILLPIYNLASAA
ncbi:MAG TPA: type II secretion system F family protein [Verrucomicrobiae bacterium]|nr:type II secretion system F family protein [Verrucomicrobiae bacterium]